MDEHDVIRKLGFPHKIISRTTLRAKNWECYRCGTVFEFDEPVAVPVPCDECGGIAFKTADDWNGREAP